MVGKGEGGRGPQFFLLVAIMMYALYSGVIAWSTFEDCGVELEWSDWRLYPPGWECPR
jgi:hypothetical protein